MKGFWCLLPALLAPPSPQVLKPEHLLGEWGYEVTWPGHVIGYHLRVFREGDRLLALMANDGHLTLDRMELRVELAGDTARFFFVRHAGEHLHDLWSEGDLLFELRKTPRGILTRWRTFAAGGEPEGEAIRFRRVPAKGVARP